MRSHTNVSDSIKDSIDELQKLHAKEYYRFIVPGWLHAHLGEKGWQGFEARHPNALPAAFEALRFAFTALDSIELTSELIQGIHHFATANVETHLQIPLGKLRKDNNGFYLAKELNFVTKQGFKEFYELVHQLKERGAGTALKVVRRNYISHSISRSEANNRLKRIKHCNNFENLFKAFKRGNYILYRAPDAIHLKELLQGVCQSYNLAIQATDKVQKLKVIAEHVQLIERFHFFPDGNGRTSLILLQRLLLQNGFLPTMLLNPDCIDGYSLTELIKEIKNGCLATKKLIQVPDYSLYGYQTQIVGHVMPDEHKQSDEVFFKNLRMKGVHIATTHLAGFIEHLSLHEANQIEIQEKPKYKLGRFLTSVRMSFWQTQQIQALQHADARKFLMMLNSMNTASFNLHLLRTFLIYYEACVREYHAEVRSASSLALKKNFLSKLIVVLPYLDMKDRFILSAALLKQETGELRFLNAHRNNRFYAPYIETKTWCQTQRLLPRSAFVRK